MMNENIEQLILSGQFFNTGDRSSSPTRSSSTGSEPDLDLDLGELTFSSISDDDSPPTNNNTNGNADITDIGGGGVGVGVPGRTGVKGVIRDRNEAVQMSQSRRALEIAELNRKMERESLGGKTFLEEEREKALLGGDERVDRIVLDEMERMDGEKGAGQKRGGAAGRFGHLREVGVKGYVRAVENEESGIWVIVHLYEPSLERCYILDDTLSHLARRFPNTKFLRARASALGFASSSSSSSATSRLGTQPRRNLRSGGGGIAARTITRSALFPSRAGADSDDDEDDDSYSNNNIHEKDYDDDDEEEDQEEDDAEEDVDTDMLPTMLVYRGGELVFNWVRVDWEAGEDGIGELLMRNHVVPRTSLASGGDGDKLVDDGDGEIDLSWADENLL